MDGGEYSARSSSGSDLDASAMIISSMLSLRVVSLFDVFFYIKLKELEKVALSRAFTKSKDVVV